MHFGFSPAFPVGAEFLYGKRNKLDVAAGVILALGPDVLSEAEKITKCVAVDCCRISLREPVAKIYV
jgi:hypothetical protein